MKIGDEVFVHGYVDEIRKDVVIVKNEGGYFGTAKEEVADLIRCKDCKFFQMNKFDDTYIDMMCTENYDGYGAYMSTRPDDYCSGAERKEE